MHLAGEEVATVVDTGASASVVGKHLATKLGIWKRTRRFKIRYENGSHLGGNFVVLTTFKVMDSYLVLGKFGMDMEVLDIWNRDAILGLSWSTENAFSVHAHHRCLRNVNSCQASSSSLR